MSNSAKQDASPSLDALREAVYQAQATKPRTAQRSKLSHAVSAGSPLSSSGTPESLGRSGLSSSSSGTIAGNGPLTSYFPHNRSPAPKADGSNASTPRHFQPMGQPSAFAALESEYPSPSVYDLTLILSSDVGLDKFWDNIVEIFKDHYRADRITLSVPYDLTDIRSTPWGLKAIWNAETTSHFPSQRKRSTHSTKGSEEWESMEDYYLEDNSSCSRRTSESVAATPAAADQANLHGVMFNTLQKLNLEEQPLLNDGGVAKVLEREGKIVVLSREYRDVFGHMEAQDTTPGDTIFPGRETLLRREQQMQPKLRNPLEMTAPEIASGVAFRNIAYEDYEQPVSSPWAQSPAPSPAILKDAMSNPFFQPDQAPLVDENAFSPSSDGPDHYDSQECFEALGMEGVNSVIHIPLVHPSTARAIAIAGYKEAKGHIPIGILSFMSSATPYPANLIESLSAFAPLVATHMSLAQSHANILHQLAYAPRPVARRSVSGPWSPDSDAQYSNSRSPSSESMMQGTPMSGSSADHYFARAGHLRRGQSEDNVREAAAAAALTAQQSASVAQRSNRPQLLHRATSLRQPPSSTLAEKASDEAASVSASATAASGNRQRSPRSSPSPRRRKRTNSRTLLHSFGANLSSSFHPSSSITHPAKGEKRPRSSKLPQPSPRLMNVIINAIPTCVLTASPLNGQITWVNERILAYTGQTPEELMSTQWECLHQDDRVAYKQGWQDAVMTGEGFTRQARMRRFDGAYRWFMTRAVPLRDSQGSCVHWFSIMMDIHDQKLAEFDASQQAETAASESKYRSLAEASPQIVFAATAKEGITYANTQWLKYSGQEANDALGLGFLSHVHPEDRAKSTIPADIPASSDEPITRELRLRNHLGEYRWHLVRCVQVDKAESSQAQMWLGTCSDINDHKLLEVRLKDASDSATKSMESKTRFLSNMSHEIRTPLIGITGMVNFLLDTTLSTEQLDYAHTIQQSAEALLAVINDILDLSKVEAGMMKLIKEPFPVRDMVEDANELLSTLAMSKQLELNYMVEEDVPDVVVGDRIRLRQVLLNILGNAIKFTSSGEVFTRCFVVNNAELQPDEVMVAWEVIDSGPGFSKEEEATMFKPFSQLDGSLTRKHGGTGLGLVISRQLVELHEGKLSCTSTKGAGSTFTFTAKFTVPQGGLLQEREARQTLAREASSRSATPVRETGAPILPTGDLTLPRLLPETSAPDYEILIVSHTVYSIVALNHHVRVTVPRHAQSTIITSDHFEAALSAVTRDSTQRAFTHIIINVLDISQILQMVLALRRTDGYATCKLIVVTTPVSRNLILESAAEEQVPVDPEQVSFVFKLVKPSKFSQFFDPTSERCESADARRQTAQQVVMKQKAVFDTISADVGHRGLTVLLVEDNPVNQKVMSKFCKKSGLAVDLANDGIECLRRYEENPARYALVLMDLHMPNLDGYQACTRIRELERAANVLRPGKPPIPIIALSANVMTDVAERCNAAGFTAYLSKPVAFQTLSEKIAQLV
ncbi:hypothetical protein BCR37DRAFT_365011 [Protomyces lactucae-debilis]|uniref:histidine kinase n=1 Tax=Protomyces lactucae-debilis TaxID=2754530 RepID=A0A1Y2FQH4_PROLT|nr:uncharacterized protein BCR37DRAFT_365011 [Protomyces lactucae-debilis]ORY85456.1 hypothetical protein BCR37DRAFT_365011 [Protomyces lactucae-debilis]